MSYVSAGFIVLGFLYLMKLLGLVEKSLAVIGIAKSAASDLQNRTLDDDTKEQLMQSHAKKLFAYFAVITAGSIAAVFVPVGVIMLAEIYGMLSLDEALSALISVEFLVPSTVISCLVIWMSAKK